MQEKRESEVITVVSYWVSSIVAGRPKVQTVLSVGSAGAVEVSCTTVNY